MERLLPQADSLDKVIKVFAFCYTNPNYTQQDIASFLGFKDLKIRQCAYYINANYYLGLLDEFGQKSQLAEDIMQDPSSLQSRVYELVMSDKYCSRILAKMLISQITDTKALKQYTISILTPDFGKGNSSGGKEYSSDTIERRAHTLNAWCLEVYNYIKSL